MSTRWIAIVSALALTLAVIPGVGAQDDGATGETDRVTFYGHVFGHRYAEPMPSNTEAPIGENNYGFGSYHWCTDQAEAIGLPPTTVNQKGCRDSGENTLVLFSTPGFVDVQDRAQWQSEGTYSLLHNERGQTKDIQLDPSQTIEASIFLTVDFHGWAAGGGETSCIGVHPEDVPCVYPYWGWDVGTQPNFVVEATMYKAQLGEHGANASDAPPVGQAIDSGEAEIVAQGQWGPDQSTVGIPGSPAAQQFTIDMGTPQVDTIPKEEDFFIVYRYYSDTPAGSVGVHTWRLWSGEFFPPTYTLPVENAFDVERVVPNFAHGKMAIVGVMNTPWGSYDIDPDTVDLTIEGPNGEVTPEHISQFGDFSVAHGGHYLPINITWIWDYQQEGLQPGDYTISLSASNFQNSAAGACQATFSLKSGEAGRLVPGQADEGVCGLQSASDDFVEQVTEGASEQGGN